VLSAGFGKGAAAFNVVRHGSQNGLHGAWFLLFFENSQTAENGQARILKRTELPRDLGNRLGFDSSQRGTPAALFLSAGRLGLGALLANASREVA
jgi:hypothetical protein